METEINLDIPLKYNLAISRCYLRCITSNSSFLLLNPYKYPPSLDLLLPKFLRQFLTSRDFSCPFLKLDLTVKASNFKIYLVINLINLVSIGSGVCQLLDKKLFIRLDTCALAVKKYLI